MRCRHENYPMGLKIQTLSHTSTHTHTHTSVVRIDWALIVPFGLTMTNDDLSEKIPPPLVPIRC